MVLELDRVPARPASEDDPPPGDLIEGRDLSKAINYSFSHKFKDDDVVKHKTFGVGVVARTLSGGKMEVVFPESTRLLVHSR